MDTYINRSPFIHLMKTSSEYYIYDVNKNDILEIPKDIYNYLNSENKDVISNNATYQYIEILKKKGYLKGNRVEVSEHPVTEYYDSFLNYNLSFITLQITQQCNLNCDYCVYSGGYYNRQHAKKNMSFDTAKKAIDYLIQHSRDAARFAISFYGGEPLLAFEMMKECVKYAEDRAEGRQPSFNITTNGTLLTSEKFDFLVKHNFRILISLDGPKHLHNKHRKFQKSDIGSFDTIIKNVNLLRKEYSDFYRNNVSFNMVLDPINKFSDINDYVLDSEMFDNIFFSSSVITSNYAKNEVLYNEEFIVEYEYEMFKLFLLKLGWLSTTDLSPLVLNHFSFIRRMAIIIEEYLQEEVPNKSHRGGPCLPGVMKLFVSVDGELYPCERVSEISPAAHIGHVDSGIDLMKAKKVLNIERETTNTCRNCWAYYFCKICVAKADDGKTISAERIINSCEQVKKQLEEELLNYCVLKELGYNHEFDL